MSAVLPGAGRLPRQRNAPARPLPAAPPPSSALRPPPRLSVVVPTYRRPELLKRCLKALLRQSIGLDAIEIIVVDDGHSNATQRQVALIAERLPPQTLHYLRPDAGRGPAVARNCGWRAARAPLVAFTDDDTVPHPDWLAEGEQAMQDGAWVAVAGRVAVPLTAAERARPTDHQRMTLGLESAEFVTANAFVRVRALAQVGGFDERFRRAWREDSDLQYRLQAEVGPVGHCSRALVLHPVRPEAWGVSLRQQKNVFYDALLYAKHPRLYRERVRPVPPWDYYLIVALAIAALVLAFAGQPPWAAGSAAAAVLLVLRFAARRLRGSARTPAHLLEMLGTSALIPFLSVFWRLRGAWHFRVLFL